MSAAGTSGFRVRRTKSRECARSARAPIGISQGGRRRAKQHLSKARRIVYLVYFRSHGEEEAIAMEVTMAVLADYANVSQEGKLNILGIFQEVNPPILPFSLPQMYLVVSFEAESAEFGEQKQIRIDFFDGNGGDGALFLEGQAQVPQPARPRDRVYINEVIGLSGITFEHSGDYRFSISVEGDEKATVPLYVNEPGVGGA